MRKILQITMIFSLFLTLTYISNSQTLEIVSSEENVNGSPSEQNMQAHITIKNISDLEVMVWASARKVELTEGHKYFFCDPYFCYSSTDRDELLAEEPFTLSPGEETFTNAVYIGLEPNDIPGQSIITMKFAVDGNPIDFVEFTATFDALTSVVNNEGPSFSVSEAMPNPAADMITIKYNLTEFNASAKLSLFDIFGDVIKEIELDREGQSVNIDISNFIPGTYFYRVNSGTKVFGSKFVVSR